MKDVKTTRSTKANTPLAAHLDEARRAARVLETAVGEALGPAPGHGPGRGKTSAAKDVLSPDLSWRFRLMAAHRDLWWPVLAEKANAKPASHLDLPVAP